MNLTEEQYELLAALRAASALRRQPGPANPDGPRPLWTLAALAEAGRLSAAGYGEFHPRVPNESAPARARNRRVDVVIAKGTQP